MTCLSLAGKEKNCLPVFVLHAFDLAAIQEGNVVVKLARRMRVEGQTNAMGYLVELGGIGVPLQRGRHALEMMGQQHFALGEGELEDGVVRDTLPVNELLDHIVTGPKRQDAADHLHGEPGFLVQIPDVGNLVEVGEGVSLELGSCRGVRLALVSLAQTGGVVQWCLLLSINGCLRTGRRRRRDRVCRGPEDVRTNGPVRLLGPTA